MSATTLIERFPGDWCQQSDFGDGWEIDPANAWREIAATFVSERYPGLSLCGDEIIGPHPRTKGLPESIYGEFRAWSGDRWMDLIDAWTNGEPIDFAEYVA